MNFDVKGARDAGYTDAEIADHLAEAQGFNTKQARAAGYNDHELIDHLISSDHAVQQAPKLTPETTPGVGETMLVGAGHTYDRILDGLAQAWMGATGATDSTKAALKDSVEEKARLYQPLTAARPVVTAVGESLPSMALPGVGTGGALATAGKLALTGAIPAALEYGSVEDRAKAALGGATGAVVGGQLIPAAARVAGGAAKNLLAKALGDVSPEVQNLYFKAVNLGIPVNAAQLSDSKFVKTLASVVEHTPFSGAAKTRDFQQDAFNRAISRTIGEDTPVVNQALYDAAKTRLGGEFNSIASRNNLHVSPALINDLGTVSAQATHIGTKDTGKAVSSLIDEFMSKMDPNTGTVSGDAYQALDSKLSKLTKSGDEKAVYIGMLKDALRSAMDHSITPADQEAWNTARSQYKNLKAIRDIVGKSGVEGDISPALLMGRLNATQAGKETMARGTRGDLGDIARVGTQFVKDRIPNSGTAQRLAAMSLVGGGGYMVGMSPEEALMFGVSGATSGRILNKLLNSPASGEKIIQAAGQSSIPLSALFKKVPNKSTQVLGSGAGMTIADLMKRDEQGAQ